MKHFGEREDLIGILSLLILGAGLLALFTGWTPFPFWLIFAIGYGVVLPIVAILLNVDESEADHAWNRWSGRRKTEHGERRKPDKTDSNPPRTRADGSVGSRSDSGTTTSTGDALSTLRERYARGDLTDEQFESKLDRLLETETPESAAEWRERMARDVETENS